MSYGSFIATMILNGFTGAAGAVTAYFCFQTAVVCRSGTLSKVSNVALGVAGVLFALLCWGLAAYVAYLGYLPETFP